MTRPHNPLREQVLTVAAMYVGYAFFMVLKTAPITASASMIDEGLIDKEQWGRILAYGTIGAILGKFITGWMADRFGGKFTFTLALLITAGAIALFSASSTALLFGATFFLALLAKSAGWPSMAKLIGNWFMSHTASEDCQAFDHVRDMKTAGKEGG